LIFDDPQDEVNVQSVAKRRLTQGLTARLLGVAAGFIILTEAIVFLPSIAVFRQEWLVERFDTGELAVLAAQSNATSSFALGDSNELLRAADIQSVVALDMSSRRLLVGKVPETSSRLINLEQQTFGGSIFDVIETLFAPKGRVLAIVSRPRSNAAVKLEVSVSEQSLRSSLWREINRVFFYSMLLAIMIGLLLYAALADGFVRPMRRLTGAITRFRAAPEDASQTLVPTGRNDEIGEAEIAFADMQETVRQAIFQKERLAQLGLAVSKIAHDLRHSLGAAQLVSERLAMVDDPIVKVTAPRLERALERAIALAQSTLQFGKAQEAVPLPELIYLADALDEASNEALNGIEGVEWVNSVSNVVEVEADPDQLHRILTNLIRNAGQAISATRKSGIVKAQVHVDHTGVALKVVDTGPGLPRGVKDNLFVPFSGSGLSGGTGLGLAIARDLARMNGGDITLISTDADGTVFQISLPQPS
jgi:signal transduction histidine kinase